MQKDLIKIIETSTPRRLTYELTQLSKTLWVVSGNLPTDAIKALHTAECLCYMAENEFFISAITLREAKN